MTPPGGHDELFPYRYDNECAAGTHALGVPLRLQDTGGGVMCLVADFPDSGYQVSVIDSGDGLTCSRDPDNYPFGRPTGWIAGISNTEKYGGNDDLITIRSGWGDVAPATLATLLRGLLAAANAAGHHPHAHQQQSPPSPHRYHWTTAHTALYQIVDATSACAEWHTAVPGEAQAAVAAVALGLFASDTEGLIIEGQTLDELSGFAHQVADYVDNCNGSLQRRRQARAALCSALAELDSLREQITAAQTRDPAALPELHASQPAIMAAVADAARTLLTETIDG